MKKKFSAGVAAVIIAISSFAVPAVAYDKNDVVTTQPANGNGQAVTDSFWCRVFPWLPDCRNFPQN